jgi:hypothetical protein
MPFSAAQLGGPLLFELQAQKRRRRAAVDADLAPIRE